MYNIAICDDDSAFTALFSAQLTRTLEARGTDFRLTAFSDPDGLLRSIAEGHRYELLFLDILFAEKERGLRLAAALRQAGEGCDIIFMSTCSDFAVASFDVSPLYYLLKPVEDEKLRAALDRFLERNAPRLVHLNTSHGMIQVRLAEVVFFEIYSHEIIIHKADGTKETCMGTLKELELLLPSRSFVRPHRSYLVNLDRIHKIARYEIYLSSGETVPISKGLYQQVQRAFIDYAGHR